MSVKLFQVIGPNSDHWLRIHPISLKREFGASVHASHRWGLPGVTCNACGRVWSGRLQLPAIDLSDFQDEARLREAWNAPVQQFKEIVQALDEFLRSRNQSRFELVPGTRFGPLEGTVRGKQFGDFAYIFNETVLILEEKLKHLVHGGIHGLIGVRPHLMPDRTEGQFPSMLELHVEPLAKLARDCLRPIEPGCAICGHPGKVETPARMVIDASTVPPEVDLFRVEEWINQVIVTERFREAVVSRGLSNIKFREIEAA